MACMHEVCSLNTQRTSTVWVCDDVCLYEWMQWLESAMHFRPMTMHCKRASKKKQETSHGRSTNLSWRVYTVHGGCLRGWEGHTGMNANMCARLHVYPMQMQFSIRVYERSACVLRVTYFEPFSPNSLAHCMAFNQVKMANKTRRERNGYYNEGDRLIEKRDAMWLFVSLGWQSNPITYGKRIIASPCTSLYGYSCSAKRD